MTDVLTPPPMSTRPSPARPTAVPPLREGDRMDADEFVRRWQAMPEPRPKCELLEGVVWFHMTVTHEYHGAPHLHISAWLGQYVWATPGVDGGLQSSLRLGRRSMPEPDGFLRIEERCGGQSRRGADDYLIGAAELVAEIAGSTVAKDTGLKRELYYRNGVQEYLVWRTEQGVLEWLTRGTEDYELLATGTDGVIRSRAFPGLWLDAAALLSGDRARLAEVARAGLASPEHAAFVEQLRQRAAASAASAAPASPPQATPSQTSSAQATPTEGASS